MNHNPNAQHTSQQFLDFWQEQIQRTMHDERFLGAMIDMMNAMPPPQSYTPPPNYTHPSTNPPFYTTPTPSQESHATPPFATAQTNPAPHGTTAAANQPSPVELAELLRRLERCEARIGFLEDTLRRAESRDESVATTSPNESSAL